jgi:hypothetical protein
MEGSIARTENCVIRRLGVNFRAGLNRISRHVYLSLWFFIYFYFAETGDHAGPYSTCCIVKDTKREKDTIRVDGRWTRRQ